MAIVLIILLISEKSKLIQVKLSYLLTGYFFSFKYVVSTFSYVAAGSLSVLVGI